MISTILIVIAVIIVAVVGFAALQPNEFRVSRSATMSATPARIFAQVNDFHNWEAWSPWAKLDPNSKSVFEGPASGVGAVFRWAGNKKVGEGNMTITESRPAELILLRLEFIKPFAGVNTTEFTFRPTGSGTVITWTMTGTNNLIGKVFCMFMNMDKTVGGQFEQGLANMRAIVEKTGA